MAHPATLVFQTCLFLDESLRNNDAFQGYTGDAADSARLLTQLWEIYTAPQPDGRAEYPEELADCWYATHGWVENCH